jgi:hypothetical protein
MAAATMASFPLPSLPDGWSAEKDFKAIGHLSAAAERSIEPVGPHFLAHARRARHKRTFSEDDRIQAQERAKKVEDDDDSDISEPEDSMMLQRDAKDWKVSSRSSSSARKASNPRVLESRSLSSPWTLQVPLQSHRGTDQEGTSKEGPQAPSGQKGSSRHG